VNANRRLLRSVHRTRRELTIEMDSVRKRLHATSWLALAFVLGQLACRPAPSASAPPTDATASRSAVETRQSQAAAPAPAPYDLGRDEARGGHTLARHVGRTDAELQERLRREPNISAASTYRDRIAAERVVARALAENHARVDQWLARTGSSSFAPPCESPRHSRPSLTLAILL
jgi:hypothetical protein